MRLLWGATQAPSSRSIRMFIVPSIVAVLLSVSPQVPKPQVPVGGEPDETRPLQWLLHAQNPEGGWGSEVNSPADVATTSLSGIALLRLGSTPASGDHREAAKKGLLFVIRAVERSAPRPIHRARRNPAAA